MTIRDVRAVTSVVHIRDSRLDALGIYKLGWFEVIYVPLSWIAENSGVRAQGDEGDIILNSTADPQYVNARLAMVGAYGLGVS